MGTRRGAHYRPIVGMGRRERRVLADPGLAQPVFGFDLDMTLIDTRPGFAATLRALCEETALELTETQIAEMVEQLGPPLDHMLAPHLPADAVGPAVDTFRALYPATAIDPVPLLPGAREALAAVRALGGGIVVITGKFTPNAALHLAHLAVDHDRLAGEVWGAGKASALEEHGAVVYVGDHVHDVVGARAAGVISVSVTTGGSTADELTDAGTDVLLGSLHEFESWLRGQGY